jgi:hypothetical protein
MHGRLLALNTDLAGQPEPPACQMASSRRSGQSKVVIPGRPPRHLQVSWCCCLLPHGENEEPSCKANPLDVHAHFQAVSSSGPPPLESSGLVDLSTLLRRCVGSCASWVPACSGASQLALTRLYLVHLVPSLEISPIDRPAACGRHRSTGKKVEICRF